MSQGILTILRCHAFLVLISIIFHAEALSSVSLETYPGQQCLWRYITGNSYELKLKENSGIFKDYAVLYNLYKLDESDIRKGLFCLEFMVYHFQGRKLILTINSHEFTIIGESGKECIPYDVEITILPEPEFKVGFNATCEPFFPVSGNPEIEITAAKTTEELSPTTTSSMNVPDNPTQPDVGDIQYVGVVVGAICIALFTLFSCLTIISARRSNQRESRRRTIPSVSCPEDDDRPDVVADNAPPSYDAVMACPDLYPPTPQDTPHATPETTPHLSLHRRALLNQHMGSLPGSAASTPQLHRQSFTPTITSDEWDELPDEPPPPYPGLANGGIPTVNPEDATDNVYTPDETTGVNNPVVGQPESDNSRPSSPNENSSSPVGDQENPWVLNTTGNSHLRDRNNDPTRDNTIEQYPMRDRTPDGDSTHSNHDEDSQRESSSRSNSPDEERTETTENRIPKAIDSGPANVPVRVAVV